MKLVLAILTSLAISVACAAALAFLIAHGGTSGAWLGAPFVAAAGGPLVLAPLLYTILIFALLTAGALSDLDRARARLHRAVAEGPAVEWDAVLAGTAFEPIAGHLAGDELRLAPLSLLRVLRAEMWRIYLKRLVAGEAVTLALLAVMVLAPAAASAPAAAVVAMDGRLVAVLALLLGGAVAGAWIALDGAFGRIGRDITQACGPLAMPPLAAPEPAVRMPAVPGESGAAADMALALRALAPVLAQLDETLRRLEPADSDGVAKALGEVAAALDRVADAPAAPHRDEIYEILQRMGATLDAVAAAMRAVDRRPRSVTDELDDLLDEISDLAPRGAPKVA